MSADAVTSPEAPAGAKETAAAAAQEAAATVVPPAPVKAAPAEVPPGELYKFKPWQTALIFLVALLLDLPFWIDRLGGRIYPVHKSGIVLVTGASTGIGRDAALALAKREPKMVVFAGVRNGAAGKAIEALKVDNLKPLTLDVTSDGSVQGAYKTITKEMAKRGLPFVGLVNNAGVSANAPVEFHSVKDAQALFDVNYFGLLRTTQKFLPLLRKSKGRIVNVSSILGALTVQLLGVYSDSKHAMESLSDALRRELRPLDVSVSIVQPGFVKSPIHDKVADTRKKLPAEAEAVYPHLFSKARAEMSASHLAKASSTACTSNAIHHALVSSTPKTRYPVANSGGVPAPIVTLSSYLFPDRLTDYLLS